MLLLTARRRLQLYNRRANHSATLSSRAITKTATKAGISYQTNLFILSLILPSLLFISCNKQHALPPLDNGRTAIQIFLDSKTFSSHRAYIESFGTISYTQIKDTALILAPSDTMILIILPILQQAKIIGYVESVNLKSSHYLPNEDVYALNYVDLKAFNTSSMSGKIEMIDLNYDNYTHSHILIKENKILYWLRSGLPRELSIKYASLKKNIRSSINLRSNSKKAPIYTLCDSNNDNNISFSECYKCATDAITADGFSSFICDFPGLGWFSCWTTKTAACVYISARY